MSIIKTVLKYIFILLGLIVSIGIVTIAVMYFFPSVKLFGYEFYKGSVYTAHVDAYSDTTQSTVNDYIKINADIAGDFDKLVINTNGYDVFINTFEDTALSPLFYYDFTYNMKGLKKVEDKGPYVKATASMENTEKVLSFDVIEPSGVFIRNKTQLFLYLPNKVANFKLLEIKNNKGIVSVGNLQSSNIINVETLKVNSNRGAVDMGNTIVSSSLIVEKNSGKFIINSTINADVEINSSFANLSFANVNGNVLALGNNPSIKFNNIVGNVNVKVDYGLFVAKTIDGQLSVLSNPITNKKNCCDVHVETLTQSLLVNNETGIIDIGQVSSINDNSSLSLVEIQSNNSDISINKCYAKTVNIEKNGGILKLGEVIGKLNVSTTQGNIDITFADETTASGELLTAISKLKTYTQNIESGRGGSGNGTINVKNVNSTSNIISNGSGKISVKYQNIIGNNVIMNKGGSVDVIVPSNKHLFAWDAKTSVNIKVFTVETTELSSKDFVSVLKMTDGYVKMFGANSDCLDKLKITASNSHINVKDTTRNQ